MSDKAVIQGHSIRRTIHIDAPIARVWAAITEPELISEWFGESTVFTAFEVGATGTFAWEGHGVFALEITEIVPLEVFAYRWVGEPDAPLRDDNSTTARFTIAAAGDGTVLTVVESGFDALSGGTARRRARLDENREGWNEELDELVAFLS